MSDNIHYYQIMLDTSDEETPYYVYQCGTYERSSVLAGQAFTRCCDCFATMAEAVAQYPKADDCTAIDGQRPLRNDSSLAWLPGEDDPVPGGAYPDD